MVGAGGEPRKATSHTVHSHVPGAGRPMGGRQREFVGSGRGQVRKVLVEGGPWSMSIGVGVVTGDEGAWSGCVGGQWVGEGVVCLWVTGLCICCLAAR